MKRFPLISSAFILFSLVCGCQNNDTKSKTTGLQSSSKKEERKIYKQNEEAFITSKSQKIYSLTFNDAKVIDIPAGYEKDMPKNTKKILVLTYTYKYIKEDKKIGTLDIEPSDFMVYDRNNLAVEYIQIGSGDYPFDYTAFQELDAGRSVQNYAPFALKNDTPTIQIDFNSKLFNQKLTFEIPVEGK
jgi:hypothetical protein